MRKIFKFLATGCGLGYLPAAPGTAGTVAGVFLYIAVHDLPLFSYILFAVTFAVFSIWVTERALPDFGTHDPSQIVIDEIAGFLFVMIGQPFTWVNIGLAFVLFRLFDILKPPPARQLERLKGGWGVVFDDVAAGIFACGTLAVIRLFYKHLF